jgi:glycosyltransferase involved in cell wall biosynthesis
LLEERKGHRFLLEAAALLKQRGHRLRYCFAGEGLQRGRLEALARERGLEGEVGFMGFVADIPDFLSRIDIFVLPSLYEGLGVAVLEAMAAAKPVVASRVGGLPELVADRETGFLVPPGDAAALADSIGRLVPEQILMDAMGERGRERVEQLFTLERMAARNEEFYYDLLGQ